MTARTTASERLRRLLAILPWIAERDGPTVEEICQRFSIRREDLLADLDVVFMVGLPPYTPDTLIDVFFEDDRVWINLGDFFRRPLRLTPAEALAVVVASSAATSARDADGPLARGLSKLRAALGTGEEVVDISLGGGEPTHLDAIRDAIRTGHSLRVSYYSFNRDATEERTIDPYRLISRDGHWYLLAWCHQAAGERLFRLDRVAEVTVTADHFEPRSDPQDRWLDFDGVEVTLRLAPGARWVAEHVPTRGLRETGAGLEVTLAVSELPWLARLLVRLGPDAEVVDVAGDDVALDAEIRGLAANTARKILRRYETGTHR